MSSVVSILPYLAAAKGDVDDSCPQSMLITEQSLLVESYKIYKKSNPKLGIEDFKEDFLRFTYVPKLLKIYKNKGKLNTRLVLNHLVILYNVFDSFATRVLFIKADKECYPEIFTLIKFFSREPKDGMVYLLDQNAINTSLFTQRDDILKLIDEALKASTSEESDGD